MENKVINENKIINCKQIAQCVKEQVKREIEEYVERGLDRPYLVTIQVGEDGASTRYVRNKHNVCAEVGIESVNLVLKEDIEEEELLTIIQHYNLREDVHGILVQLPLPSHLDTYRILNEIKPEKDVDGFTTYNKGLPSNHPHKLISCTPKGIVTILEEVYETLAGKNVVIIGRSEIVGKPLAQLLTDKDATVTLCHSKTKGLPVHTSRADILVCAIGRANYFKYDWELKMNTTIIDVGINTDMQGKLCGDFMPTKETVEVVGVYTSVPGGVGVMTVASLMQNVLQTYKRQVHR